MPENQTRFPDLAARYKYGPLVLQKSVVATWSVEVHKKSLTEEGHLGCVHRMRILEEETVKGGVGTENGHLSGIILVTNSMEPGRKWQL